MKLDIRWNLTLPVYLEKKCKKSYKKRQSTTAIQFLQNPERNTLSNDSLNPKTKNFFRRLSKNNLQTVVIYIKIGAMDFLVM